MSLGKWLHDHLRGSIQIAATARPDYYAGLRAATATVPPLLFGELHEAHAFVWMALGGWLATLADSGGPYRTRALSLAAYAGAASLLTVLAGLGSGQVWLAVPLLFAVALATNLARIYGEAASTVGALVLITLCVAEGSAAGSPGAALVRAGMLCAGCGVAALLSLGLWPVHPYKPAREAVAGCYQALRDLALRLHQLAQASAPEAEWLLMVRTERPRVRDALEKARRALGSVRRQRESASARGEHLVVLFELAELSLGGLGALTEALLPGQTAPQVEALLALSDAYAGVARAVPEGRQPASPAPGPLLPQGGDEADAHLRELSMEAGLALENAALLQQGRPARLQPGAASGQAPWQAPDSLPSLRETLQPGSLVLRHALRVALTTSAALLFCYALQLPRSHWVTVTAVIILQPSAGATVRRALQRVAGTLFGATAAALLAPLLHGPLGIAAALFPLSVLAVALRPLNYGLFAALVTPVFVLMAETTSGNFHLVPLRIGNTLLGGAFALLGTYLLWPVREREHLPEHLAELLSSLRGYLRAVARGSAATDVLLARRNIGLAATNAEASLQRFLSEPHRGDEVEPAMAVLAWSRRLSGSLTALRSAEPVHSPLRHRAEALDQELAELALAARERRAPTERKASGPRAGETPQEMRLERQLQVLRGALARLAARE